jgi:ABC-2 type transport system ATP-binding protein
MEPLPNDADPVLRIVDVTRRFGDLTAVDALRLSLPGGSVLGLLGPNGAGKTTLLRMINGLIPPTSGAIRLFGDLPPGDGAARRMIGYMPQQPALYPGLTVEENLRFFGRMYGVDGADLTRRVDETLAFVDLGDRRATLLAALSGGMMRRASLGVALVHRPRLLLLDEPTAGVDPMLRIRIWDILRRLCDEGTSVLITTHHIAEASRSDRVVFLRDGGLLAEGTPSALMDRYGATDLEEAFVRAVTSEAGETPQ